MIKKHPSFSDLSALLHKASGDLTIEWHGTVFRCVAPKWARPEYLVSGKGTLRFGSRWMAPGLTSAVYAASTEAIALKESRRLLRHFGIRKPRLHPKVIVEMEVTLKRVADLSLIDKILSWPTLEELLGEDWERINSRGVETLSQAFGRALWVSGHAGLLVPSTRDRRGRNLVWFPSNLAKDDAIRISGESELDDWIVK